MDLIKVKYTLKALSHPSIVKNGVLTKTNQANDEKSTSLMLVFC